MIIETKEKQGRKLSEFEFESFAIFYVILLLVANL